MMREREGELLNGRYRIEGPTADGYAATDLTSGQRVHVAFVAREAAAGARRAKELSGANVVKVLDVGETAEGATWIAREHLSSHSLTRHLSRKGPLSTRDAIEVALGICDAIAEANGHGLSHGAIDASNVFLAWSASGLVDVQLTGIGLCQTNPRDDVRAIAKLIEVMLGGRVPADLRATLGRGTRSALDFADTLVPYAVDPDFAGDRVAARRLKSATSTKVFADGAYPQSAFPTPAPAMEIAPVVTPTRRRPARRPAKISRDLPTVIAPRPAMSFSRRRALRVLGIVTAAISVALLVLIGTEGARIAHTSRTQAPAPVTFVEATPPAQASIAPPVEAAPAVTPSATPVPVVHTADLPTVKHATPKKKSR